MGGYFLSNSRYDEQLIINSINVLAMYKITLLLICLSLCQFGFSQNVKMEIAGAIIISDSESQAPVEGTIRWTGQDFEGYMGSTWKSLTSCDGDNNESNCPDPQYISHTITDLTSSSVKITVTLSQFLPMRFSYYPTSDPSQIQYRSCESSTNYDMHIQTISGLSADTEYTLTVQTSSTDGAAGCDNMTWVDISCPFTITTSGGGGNGTDCMTFAEIRTAGRAENCYEEKNPDDYVDSHLAEFLWLNPTVSDWTIDESAQEICAVPDPAPSNAAVMLPPSNGVDDSNMLETVINSNGNGEVVGQGTYLIGSTVDVNVPIKIFNIPTKLVGNVAVVWDVNSSNVEFYNSIIDAQNLPSAHDGWRVFSGSDNFILTRSGIENIYHLNGNNAHGVLILGANNFRITCNKFNSLINDGDAMRAIRVASSENIPQPRGDVANNESIDIQSRSTGTVDPEFFVCQGFTGSIKRIRVMANRCINAGKRLTKWQDPDGFVGSNFYHWREQTGVFGNRIQSSVVNCQLDASRITAVNNRIKIESGGRWGAVLQVSAEYNNYTFHDIRFDCNDIELIDSPAANFYALGIAFKNKDSNSPDSMNKLNNCSTSKNVFRGPGGTNHIFSFNAGYDDDASSLDIDISGNTVNTPVVISVFRGSSATLPN